MKVNMDYPETARTEITYSHYTIQFIKVQVDFI